MRKYCLENVPVRVTFNQPTFRCDFWCARRAEPCVRGKIMTPRARARRPYFFEKYTNPGKNGTFLCEITIISGIDLCTKLGLLCKSGTKHQNLLEACLISKESFQKGNPKNRTKFTLRIQVYTIDLCNSTYRVKVYIWVAFWPSLSPHFNTIFLYLKAEGGGGDFVNSKQSNKHP